MNNYKEILLRAEKGQRISAADAIVLYKEADLADLAKVAHEIRIARNGMRATYIRNFHVEPTNICIYRCKFCSYRRKEGANGSWKLSPEEIIEKVSAPGTENMSEVHIVGAVYEGWDVHYFATILRSIRKARPNLHIKAFSAVEIAYMCQAAGVDYETGLRILKEAGLNSIPGGGAEIFNDEIRKQVCPDKIGANAWLEIHEIAHRLGIHTNATMLYGHIESFEHRVEHMALLRELQDKTGGFNAFIPLKFRNMNNDLSTIQEVSVVDDFKNYAIARIFLDNFQHIKAYWPMLGKDNAFLSLHFGVDDLDGTIDDSTKIYEMAGGDENPQLSVDEFISSVKAAGFEPIERDALYNPINN